MGLFDTIHCEYPLPDARHQDLDFQTKDLECFLETYTITRDGRLVLPARRAQTGLDHSGEQQIHGDIHIYTSERSEDKTWIEYVVRFTHGRVEWIRPLGEASQEPETQPEPSEGVALEAPADAEEALLQNLRRDRNELTKLLQECSDHWGYEDPVYRFYHQSFKVYGLQPRTQSVVDRLQALAPGRPLNSWFLEIVRSGTGKDFKSEDNAHWAERTRPILEAFFHARFLLEMAVRYADLDAPPNPLPSGYAALLELFGMR